VAQNDLIIKEISKFLCEQKGNIQSKFYDAARENRNIPVRTQNDSLKVDNYGENGV
jgi:hypothetical protein